MEYVRYVVLSCIYFMFFSCSHTNKNIRDIKQHVFDPNLENLVKGSGNVRLLSHQLLPIDYLHKHPEIKGLLINHYMGTGKTYLGIGFAQSYPDRPVIILAPKFLQSNWEISISNYGVTDPSRFTFVSYDDAPKKLRNKNLSEHIILADEVHNIVRLMRSIDSAKNEAYADLYLQLRSAYKIIGLTGTPIYSDESDLAFLINLIAGEDLMPFNKESFRLKYTKIIPQRQFFRGYFTENNTIISGLPIYLGLFGMAIAGGGVNFETGLFNNFNAGAGFSVQWPTDSQFKEGNGAIFRFFFLGKPYIPLTERISIFAKFTLGLSTGLFPESQAFLVPPPKKNTLRFEDYMLGFGFNGSALVGVNFFPWSRVGFFAEAGIGSDLFWFRPFTLLPQPETQWDEFRHIHPKGHWIRYMIYDFPLNIGLHIIL